VGTYVITGANRGIGLELTRQLSAGGERVIAAVRRPDAAGEAEQAGARIEPCDVGDEASVHGLASQLGGEAVDVLINNAGVFPDKGMGLFDLDADAAADCLRINAVGPITVTRALTPMLERGSRKLVVNMSSTMGSLKQAENGATGNYAYRASKAALNMITVLMASDLGKRGITCVAIHPGWVETDMGGKGASLSPQESTRRLLETFEAIGAERSGSYLDTDGSTLPW